MYCCLARRLAAGAIGAGPGVGLDIAPVVAQANYTPTGIPGVQLNNSLAPNMVQGGMVAPGSGPPPGTEAPALAAGRQT